MKHILGIFLLIVISTAPCWAQADGVQRVEAVYGSRVYTLSLPQGVVVEYAFVFRSLQPLQRRLPWARDGPRIRHRPPQLAEDVAELQAH